MEADNYLVSRYDGAIPFLPYSIREQAKRVIRSDRAEAEEFRLRIGYPPTILLHGREVEISREKITKRDLDMILELATGASAHSVSEQLRCGYITVRGGYRIGLCGSAIVRSGEMSGFSAVSSVVLRVSREIKGSADGVMQELRHNGVFYSTLIVSPPGGGKTTLLRDIIRQLSDGDAVHRPMRVSLADERGEVASLSGGEPQMDVGRRTDVLGSCPKANAMDILLRVMNPEVIALDEITAPQDLTAIFHVSNCGVKLLATAHGESVQDLMTRSLYRQLLDSDVFRYAVIITGVGRKRTYEVVKLK